MGSQPLSGQSASAEWAVSESRSQLGLVPAAQSAGAGTCARRGGFERCLFDNMVGKKKRLLDEAAQVDETLRALLQRNT